MSDSPEPCDDALGTPTPNGPAAADTTEWTALRALFPVTQRYAYFNVAANAPLPIPVERALGRYASDLAAHGSRNYLDWFATARRCRARAAQLIGADASEIALVRNTSDGLLTVANGLGLKRGDSIVLVHGDFPANVYPWLKLREAGVEVRLVRTDERHRLQPEHLLAACDSTTRLIAVSFVSFATGFRIDLETISQMARPRGILLCVDAIQGLGALRLDVKRHGIDFLSADGHKWLLTPEGIGVFFVRHELLDRLRPQAVSWLSMKDPFDTARYRGELHDDARRFEFATPNTAGIFALDAALGFILDIGIDSIERRVLDLSDLLCEGLRQRGMKLASPRGDKERSGIVAFEVPGIDGSTVVEQLLASGVQCAVRAGFVRAATHFYNDASDIERLLRGLDGITSGNLDGKPQRIQASEL